MVGVFLQPLARSLHMPHLVILTFVLATVFTCLPPTVAAAEGSWTLAGGNLGKEMVYVDLSRLKHEGKQIRAWVLYNYEEPQRLPNGRTWKSMVLLDEFDCTKETARNLQTYLYELPFGRGTTIESNTKAEKEAIANPPDSAGDRVLRLVCDKLWPRKKR